MTTSRERFLHTLEFEPVSLPWVRCYSFLWDKTIEIWRTQGYDDQPLDDVFGLDRLVRVDPWYGPAPEFDRHVVEEDERTVLYINHEGILMRELKEHPDTSMPQFVRFPVEDEEDYEIFAEHLGVNAVHRFTEEWKQQTGIGRVEFRPGKDNLDAVCLMTIRISH